MRDLPVRVDSCPRSSDSARRSRRSASGWADWLGSLCGETIRKLAGPSSARPDPVDQRLADHRLVGDDEHVGHPLSVRVVDDDVLDRDVTCGFLDPVDDVLAEPARLLDRMGGDDDVGRRRIEHPEGVPDRGLGVGLEHEPVRGDAGARAAAKACDRGAVSAAAPARVLVDDVSGLGVDTGARTVTSSTSCSCAFRFTVSISLLPVTVSFATTSRCLNGTSSVAVSVAVSRSPFRIACFAPRHAVLVRVPNHLWNLVEVEGGGEETCHRACSARHGLRREPAGRAPSSRPCCR